MQVYTLLQRLLCSRNKFGMTIINIKYNIVAALIIFLFSVTSAFAKAPECPLYSTKKECLASVEENYKNFLDFIEEEYDSPQEKLIEAANDIKKYETLACQKTCLN